MIESTDPDLYPGTTVLSNLRDIRDPSALDRFEAESTARRIIQLIHTPVRGRFDRVHLQLIHRSIFQDVYPWAGQFRTVNISKGGHLFGAAAFIGLALDRVLRSLSEESFLQETDPDSFARRAGFYLGEINAVHPFRDGNGRAQREFIRELGVQAGFFIDWSRITRHQMPASSSDSFQTGNSTGLAALTRACVS